MRKEHTTGNEVPEGKFMSSVKVGAKGQVVIPKEARDLFNIMPGDTLILFADKERGIAMQRLDFFSDISKKIFGDKTEPKSFDNDFDKNLYKTIKKATDKKE